MSLSGRRPNDRTENAKDRAKRVGMGILDGLSALGTVMADGPKHERIKEIDGEIERLRHERNTLIATLIEPGNLKVDDDYDPHKAVIINPPRNLGDGRLTECPGRVTRSVYDSVHPGCPYKETIHGRHEFTLRD
jgi:hypothetical protein